ncbi:MAG: ATP-binding protein [Anaerolineaceae bacterium]
MRVRLLITYLLVVLVAVGSLVLMVRSSVNTEVQTFMFRGGMTGLTGLVDSLEEYYQTNGSWQGVDSLLSTVHGMGPGMGMGQGMGGMMNQSLKVANADGVVVAANRDDTAIGNALTEQERQNVIELQDTKGKTVGYLWSANGLTLQRGVETPLVSRLNRSAWAAALAAGVVALVVSLLLATQIIRPVQALTNAAHRMATGDLSTRVTVKGEDEVAQLGSAFNHMAESLQRAETSRKAMTTDIAHELRTPLAVQRAQLEALQDGIDSLTPENLQPVLDQNRLLVRLVEDLRLLALADAGELRLSPEPTDFAALAARMAERFRVQADANGIALSLSGEGCLSGRTVMLDSERVEQIISNLLANALRYTPEGGKVTLNMHCEGSMVELAVTDSGPGIPEDALPHLFERFYRADRSRSRKDGGTGLGLAIARQLTEAHGGSLTAENAPEGGARFRLRFPVK